MTDEEILREIEKAPVYHVGSDGSIETYWIKTDIMQSLMKTVFSRPEPSGIMRAYREKLARKTAYSINSRHTYYFFPKKEVDKVAELLVA